MSTPGEQPRPQYGEYATPEEQRARIEQSGATPPPVPEQPYVPHPPTAPATTAAAQPTRRADRIITFALLAYGLFTVVSAIPQLLDFTSFAQTWMEVAGVDAEFTNHSGGVLWGRIGAIVFAIGWLLTALASWASLSRRRVSWWIPLVGAIVTFVIVSVCLAVPLLGDAAVAEHFAIAG